MYNSLLEGNKHFKLTKEGKIDKYLGIELIDNGQGSFQARQLHLIKRFIEYSGLEASLTNSRSTPATTNTTIISSTTPSPIFLDSIPYKRIPLFRKRQTSQDYVSQ